SSHFHSRRLPALLDLPLSCTSSAAPRVSPLSDPALASTPLCPALPSASIPLGCDMPRSLLPTASKTTAAAARTTTPDPFLCPLSPSLPRLLSSFLRSSPRIPSTSGARTPPSTLSPLPSPASSATALAPPAANVLQARRSCRYVPPVRLSTPRPRSSPPPSLSLPPAPRILLSHMHRPLASATLPCPPSRFESAASSPSLRTPPAPYPPATPSSCLPAALLLSLRSPCSTRQVSSLLPLLAPTPLPLPPPHGSSASPLSLQAPLGTPGSSPDSHFVPRT